MVLHVAGEGDKGKLHMAHVAGEGDKGVVSQRLNMAWSTLLAMSYKGNFFVMG